MYEMILHNGKKFKVNTLIDIGGVLEIEFSQGTTYAEVANIYDASLGGEYSEAALRRFELIDEEGQPVGTHLGYTDVVNISAFNGVVKVQVKKELELKTEVEELKKLVHEQDELIASLIMEVWQ